MKLTQLKYALSVARENSFSRAAEACNVSQPSLSVAIKNLEEELNVTLFERFSHDVQQTREGEKILRQASLAMEEIERIKQIAESTKDELSGPFRIGAIYSVGPYIFPKLIPQIHNGAPDMTLLVEENFTHVLLEYLAQGKVDAALVALPFDHPGMETIPLYNEPFVAALPQGHEWEGRDDLCGDELVGRKLLLLGRGHCFREQVLEVCSEPHALEDDSDGLHNIIEGNSLETIRHMVAVGTGITVLPTSCLENFLCTAQQSCPMDHSQTVKYAYFKQPTPSRTIALAFRKSFPNTKAINAVVDAVGRALPNGCELIR